MDDPISVPHDFPPRSPKELESKVYVLRMFRRIHGETSPFDDGIRNDFCNTMKKERQAMMVHAKLACERRIAKFLLSQEHGKSLLTVAGVDASDPGSSACLNKILPQILHSGLWRTKAEEMLRLCSGAMYDCFQGEWEITDENNFWMGRRFKPDVTPEGTKSAYKLMTTYKNQECQEAIRQTVFKACHLIIKKSDSATIRDYCDNFPVSCPMSAKGEACRAILFVVFPTAHNFANHPFLSLSY